MEGSSDQDLEVGDDSVEPQREILNGLPVLETEVLEFTAAHLGLGFTHALSPDPEGFDRGPSCLGGVLRRQNPHHLRRHPREDDGEGAPVISLVVGAVGHSTPESGGLQLHLHDQRPLHVVGPCQHHGRWTGRGTGRGRGVRAGADALAAGPRAGWRGRARPARRAGCWDAGTLLGLRACVRARAR